LAGALTFPKPDIVHAMDWSVYLSGVYAASLYNVPLVVSMQLSPRAMNYRNIYYCNDMNTVDGKWINETCLGIENVGLQLSNKIIQVSDNYANNYFKEFSHKNIVIPNGIDLSVWKPTEKFEFPGNGKYKIVYIGRFTSMKSITELVNSEIPKEIDLIFIGDEKGGDTTSMNDLQKALSEKENIHYVGSKYDQDKINALFSADAVIVPSKHEPFGIVGLEALASKSILLSSRVDGLSDFSNNFNSLYCGHTSETISKSFIEFLNLSEERKEDLIANGLKTCKSYDWDVISNSYYDLYEELINNNNKQ
jgi:glycogen(starch) synthase